MQFPRTPELGELIGFAVESYAARIPFGASWHPGDIVWELRGDWDRLSVYSVWGLPGDITAAAFFDSPGQAWVEVLADHEGLLPEIARWMEEAVQALPAPPERIAIRAGLTDTARIQALEALGFARTHPDSVGYAYDLAGPLPDFAVPGYRVIDSVGIDPVRRAKAHRDPWNALDHLGITGGSQFTTEAYLGLLASPVYDPALDLLVEEEATGALVANVCGWIDPRLPVGIFEPMGTSPQVRGMRLARLLLLEGLRRMQARGMRWGRIGTAHFNYAAQKAYVHAGFTKIDESWWWSKPL